MSTPFSTALCPPFSPLLSPLLPPHTPLPSTTSWPRSVSRAPPTSNVSWGVTRPPRRRRTSPSHHITPFIHPLYTLYTPFIAVYAPMIVQDSAPPTSQAPHMWCTCWTHHIIPFIHPLYTFIAVHTPMYTRYTCIYTIYTPNTPLNTLYTPYIHHVIGTNTNGQVCRCLGPCRCPPPEKKFGGANRPGPPPKKGAGK